MTPADAILHRAVGEPDPAWFKDRFAANGWTGSWRGTVFARHHWHANTHEVLGCYAGEARLQLGGDQGPILRLAAGDVLVIPVGVAHCNLGASDDFAVVGAYPDGAEPDMHDGEGDPDVTLPWPSRDPILGAARGCAP